MSCPAIRMGGTGWSLPSNITWATPRATSQHITIIIIRTITTDEKVSKSLPQADKILRTHQFENLKVGKVSNLVDNMNECGTTLPLRYIKEK